MKDKNINHSMEDEDLLADIAAGDLPNEATVEENNAENRDDSDNAAEELLQLKDSYLRLMAEYDNYQKRTLKEKADLIKNGGEKVFVGLLPVVDDFQRALENIDKAKEMEAVKEGVDLIYHKFLTYLQQNGVKLIETLGKPFDIDLHEAVATIPAQNEEQKGIIIDTIQPGYTLNDKVIRHAKVVVAN